MGKIIGAGLIVLSLAGCAGGLPGDSSWARDYWKVADSKPGTGSQ
jgi:hypothetical protein